MCQLYLNKAGGEAKPEVMRLQSNWGGGRITELPGGMLTVQVKRQLGADALLVGLFIRFCYFAHTLDFALVIPANVPDAPSFMVNPYSSSSENFPNPQLFQEAFPDVSAHHLSGEKGAPLRWPVL